MNFVFRHGSCQYRIIFNSKLFESSLYSYEEAYLLNEAPSHVMNAILDAYAQNESGLFDLIKDWCSKYESISCS